jgi:hypothetical protein
MSATVSILVEFIDGKPKLALGAGYADKVRSYTRPGDAENYREELGRPRYPGHTGNEDRDIQILTVAIPDRGPVGDGMWPELQPTIATRWS